MCVSTSLSLCLSSLFCLDIVAIDLLCILIYYDVASLTCIDVQVRYSLCSFYGSSTMDSVTMTNVNGTRRETKINGGVSKVSKTKVWRNGNTYSLSSPHTRRCSARISGSFHASSTAFLCPILNVLVTPSIRQNPQGPYARCQASSSK
eukprot:COSAG02_NODE_7529_length_2972_cov_2.393665_2_plen_148_part_00